MYTCYISILLHVDEYCTIHNATRIPFTCSTVIKSTRSPFLNAPVLQSSVLANDQTFHPTPASLEEGHIPLFPARLPVAKEVVGLTMHSSHGSYLPLSISRVASSGISLRGSPRCAFCLVRWGRAPIRPPTTLQSFRSRMASENLCLKLPSYGF